MKIEFIIILAILAGIIAFVFLIRDSYNKFAKAEKARQARIDLRVKESRHKIDVMDRVKPGEIELDRKNPE
ncbi:hypothetical protein ES705_07757 [subsurface metagenome]